ncbi:membrane protein YczE [Pseudonocardia sp. HH130630-07]|uniref:membrane protein YczE n=1 Tax=Pseudonocardia sp. HH130630-07 TaxID=1690815 RepID=UPI000814EA7F|nr:hypothetical protein [Pseudonocardia sp. HH130630-07]ANY06183.1 hypothetical protein AFB00_07590 [Pseudonocardia sp. HH130630-07]
MGAHPVPGGGDAVELSRWKPSLRQAVMLLVGLGVFGAGEGLLVVSGLGNSPWTVLAEGLAGATGLTVGIVTNIIGLLVLLLWFPLRQRPGLGTVCNALLLGVLMDLTLAIVPPSDSVVVNVLIVVLGIGLVGLGGGLYLGAALGPGPRDGLMTGLHRTTGRSITQVRWFLEITVLIVGFLLGGTVGIGTVLFALLVGPVIGAAVKALSLVPSTRL